MTLTPQMKQDIVDLIVGRASRGFPPTSSLDVVQAFNKVLRASAEATIECVLDELAKQKQEVPSS